MHIKNTKRCRIDGYLVPRETVSTKGCKPLSRQWQRALLIWRRGTNGDPFSQNGPVSGIPSIIDKDLTPTKNWVVLRIVLPGSSQPWIRSGSELVREKSRTTVVSQRRQRIRDTSMIEISTELVRRFFGKKAAPKSRTWTPLCVDDQRKRFAFFSRKSFDSSR